MLIVKLDNNNNILVVAPYEKLFDTPMPDSGLDDQWFIDNNCVRYISTKPYNPQTQILVGTEYYVEDGFAYNVKAIDITEEDKIAIEQTKRMLG